MRSVALIGPQGAGKTTLAEMLVEFRGYQRHGIADAIKEVTRLAYPTLAKQERFTVSRYFGPQEVSGREVFQEVGAALRSVDNDFWLRVWRRDYFELIRMGYPVVIDDVRLPREAEYLKMADPDILLVRVHATPEVRAERVGPLLGIHDITEQGWLATPFDIQIDTSDKTGEQAFRILVDRIDQESV
jgi:hypothetical protein